MRGEVESRIAHGQLQGQQQLLKLAFMSRVYWKDRSCILRALGGLERSLMRARTWRGAYCPWEFGEGHLYRPITSFVLICLSVLAAAHFTS